jgi:hypothetical protein
MEKRSGNRFPRCFRESLNVYYEDESDLRLGAVCGVCGLGGYFSNDRLAVMTAV